MGQNEGGGQLPLDQNQRAVTPAVQLKKFQEETVNQVLSQVNAFNETGELHLPDDYSPGNALKSAWLILLETQDSQKKPVLESCSRESICNALLDMAVQGLSPMKKQCAFIAYGGKLHMQREYHGNIALAKRYGGVKDIRANVIYQGDDFAYEIDSATGLKKVVRHVQTLDNIDNNKIIGAYATVIRKDESVDVEIMTISQIRTAWEMGQGSGATKAHKNFTDQMCKKTVVNRACKLYISTSDDGGLVEARERPQGEDPVKEDKKKEIKERGNKKNLDIEDAKVVEPEDTGEIGEVDPMKGERMDSADLEPAEHPQADPGF